MKTWMRKLFAVLIFTLLQFTLQAHEYFFAFAEVEYNTSKRCFEVTIEASAHDVEDVMNEVGISIQELEDHYSDSSMILRIQDFIHKGFQISSGDHSATLLLKGFEVSNTGMVSFYLESAPIDLGKEVVFRFDWLMDQLPQQQNKVTFKYNQQVFTSVFLPGKRSDTIPL
jgi:hypothetical protein